MTTTRRALERREAELEAELERRMTTSERQAAFARRPAEEGDPADGRSASQRQADAARGATS